MNSGWVVREGECVCVCERERERDLVRDVRPTAILYARKHIFLIHFNTKNTNFLNIFYS
jgi:hypothetical protein